jgi:ornithine decarboxylase
MWGLSYGIASTITSLWIAFRRANPINLKDSVWAVLAGFCDATSGVLVIFAHRQGLPLGDLTAVNSTSVVFAALLAHFFLQEHLRWWHVPATLCSLVGVLLISQPEMLFDNAERGGPWIAYWLALMSGVADACMVIFSRRGAKADCRLIVLSSDFTSMIAIFACMPLVDSHFEQARFAEAPGEAISWLSALVCTGLLAMSFFALGAQWCPASISAVVDTSSRMVTGYGFPMLLYPSTANGLTAVGAILMLFTVCLVALMERAESTDNAMVVEEVAALPNLLASKKVDSALKKLDSAGCLPAVADELPKVVVRGVEETMLRAAEVYLSGQNGAAADLPVVLLDIAAVRRQADRWASALPRVEPFYAVKCNSHPAILSTLWNHWAIARAKGACRGHIGGYDCASPPEMHAVVGLSGIDLGDHVVYANPCKQSSAVELARDMGVTRLVFDNAAELEKLHELHQHADLLLRVQTDDSLAQCPLSNKFGAAVQDCGALLAQASALGLRVVGVSFHVGSGCAQLGAFRSALYRAREVFDEAAAQGLSFTMLDIGGGFPGLDKTGEASFEEHAADICELLAELFPSPDIRVIAEPGRFIASQCQAILTTVISVAHSAQGFRYYLNDGVYGSFNCLVYDHASVPEPTILRDDRVMEPDAGGLAELCTIFGPTCDGFDVISEKLAMPRLKVGDRLLFPNMGAYTSSASTSFNGFAPASSFLYESVIGQ